MLHAVVAIFALALILSLSWHASCARLAHRAVGQHHGTCHLVRAGKRAKALGFIDSGQLIGTGIGFLLAALVTSFLSFRWCFWLLGIGGAGLAVASWRTREPGRTRAAGPTRGHEQDEGEEGDGQKSRVQELVQEKGVQPNPRAMLTEES